MNGAEVSESSSYFHYFEVQSCEEGLFGILNDVAGGKLQSSDLLEMDKSLNNFPPVHYFYRHSGEFTPAACQAMLQGIDSPEAFRSSEIFQRIMRDHEVVARFKKAAVWKGHGGEWPPFWPQEYRLSPTRQKAERAISNARIWLRGLFGGNQTQ